MSTPPSPQQPEKKIHTTEIVVTEAKLIHSGEKNGRQWKIYQLIATNRDGQLIDQNLRAFSDLPKNQLIKVDVEKYDSDRFGQSYTVSLHGKSKGSGLGKKVDELRATVTEQGKRLGALEAAMAELRRGALAPATHTAAAPAQQPGPPAVGGLPDDNDIPF